MSKMLFAIKAFTTLMNELVLVGLARKVRSPDKVLVGGCVLAIEKK